MKSKELKELTQKDLAEKLENAQRALQQLKLNHSVTPLEDPTQIKNTRHDIARIKTEMRMRELNKAE